MKDFDLENRKMVIGGVATFIVVLYIIRLFSLQVVSDDYRKSADSNAFLKKIDYPSRGVIRDRNGKLLVYNQPSYDIMVVMNEAKGHLDTLDFCRTLGITKEYFVKRMDEVKDRNKNPGYSRFTQQLFMTQVDDKDFSVFQEKIFRYPGFYVQKRSIRQYQYPYGAHILGDVAEVSQSDIDEDDYYQPGDYIGKLGVERSYEKELRGEKGVKILLRDAHGRIQGRYQNGKFDHRPRLAKTSRWASTSTCKPSASVCSKAQVGAIVALDPQTGQVLSMVSSPSYDPRLLEGRNRSKYHRELSKNVWKPLLNRAIMGQYPPGSTFKTSQASPSSPRVSSTAARSIPVTMVSTTVACT
jgi:penicillin-binding protein 2